MNITARLKESIRKNVVTHLRGRYTEVQVKPEKGLFNLQCHRNCVEFCRVNDGFGIAESIYIDNSGEPILHYLNVRDGEYYETTLGWEAEHNEYYIIRHLNEKDHVHIGNEFDRSLESWANQFVKWHHRLFGITRVV